MKSKFLILAVILTALSFLAGWWRAGVSASENAAQNDQWSAMADADIGVNTYKNVAARLHATDIFPISRLEAARLAEIEKNGEVKVIEGVPEFPQIVGASVLNGVPYVHLLSGDKSLSKAKSGDELESGWQLISVDLQRVSAVYDDKEHEFLVTDYKIQAGGDENK